MAIRTSSVTLDWLASASLSSCSRIFGVSRKTIALTLCRSAFGFFGVFAMSAILEAPLSPFSSGVEINDTD